MSTFAISFFALCVLFYYHRMNTRQDIIFAHRNFFGAFEIADRNPDLEEYHYRSLYNGNILHGHQFMGAEKRQLPTSYYGHKSGLGLAINYSRGQKALMPRHHGLHIGVVGLGTGTIAALAGNNDSLHFYEIDPDIAKIANQYFYFLADTPATVNITIGDGRLELQKAWQQQGSQQFDILAIDAFNGDAIPVHLLTLEAINIYLSHLAENGILAFHISSRYVDLYPPLQALATKLKLYSFVTHNSEERSVGVYSSEWVLLSRHPEIGIYLYNENALSFHAERMANAWTDDFNYLLSVIRW